MVRDRELILCGTCQTHMLLSNTLRRIYFKGICSHMATFIGKFFCGVVHIRE